MRQTWKCPRGHRWLAEVDGAATGPPQSFFCPVCRTGPVKLVPDWEETQPLREDTVPAVARQQVRQDKGTATATPLPPKKKEDAAVDPAIAVERQEASAASAPTDPSLSSDTTAHSDPLLSSRPSLAQPVPTAQPEKPASAKPAAPAAQLPS